MLGDMFLWLVSNLKQGVIYFIKQALPPNISAGSVLQNGNANSAQQNFFFTLTLQKKCITRLTKRGCTGSRLSSFKERIQHWIDFSSKINIVQGNYCILGLHTHQQPSFKHSTLHRGAFCQFPFRRIYYYHSSKFIGKESGNTHLCTVCYFF